MGEAGEKSEAATPKRRGEARRRGQVAKSTDLAQIIVLLGVLMALGSLGRHASRVVTLYFENIYLHLDDIRLTPSLVMHLGREAMWTLLKAVGPLALLACVLGLAANVGQTGLLWATESLRPNFNKLNPLTGLQRFISPRGLVELFKSLYKVGLIGYIAFSTIRASYPQLVMMTRLEVMQGVGLIMEVVQRMALRIVVIMLVLAALDYAYQRWQHEKSLRMSKDEVRQEHKQMEASPQLKARIRSRQKQIAKERMMESLIKADVVITNPTHFAVALKYEPEKTGAPVVVAKGQDLLALKIRDVAQQNDIPIVENAPLARALYKQVDIGREIPGELYEAVAEVLAFVYEINRRRRERMPWVKV